MTLCCVGHSIDGWQLASDSRLSATRDLTVDRVVDEGRSIEENRRAAGEDRPRSIRLMEVAVRSTR